MELIAIDENMHEIGVLVVDTDIEIGKSDSLNNFEITAMPIDAAGFYIEGTEYGGFFEYTTETSGNAKITMKGWTWRGLLTQDIIIPPEGSDYKIVSGDANAIIKELLANVLGGFFYVPETASGCTITSYQFPLYIYVLDGIYGMLEEHGYRLSIHAEKTAAGMPVIVTVEAVASSMVGGTANEDSPAQITLTDNRMGINHLVCMGAGELQERQRLDLYIQADGSIGKTQYYTGFAERTAYYDYGSVESTDELRKHGEEKLLSVASSRTVQVKANSNQIAEVGDMVRASLKGEVITTPIIKKIVKIKDGVPGIEYKTKDEQ